MIRTVMTAMAIAVASMNAAGAASLFGADFGAPGDFYGIDTTTGTATLIGDPANNAIGDLTSDTRTSAGPVWGVDITANALVTFNTATGGIVNTIGISNTLGPITSIAFDPVTGVLYGNDTTAFALPNGGPAGIGQLYAINTGTGAATPIGTTGFDNIFALGFDQTGQLFGIDNTTSQFVSIDTSTGIATSIGSTGLSSSFDIASDPLTNTMYLVDSGPAELFTVDTATAMVTQVGPWGGAATNIAGLAFAPIPVPGALPLLLTGLGALTYMRRKRTV